MHTAAQRHAHPKVTLSCRPVSDCRVCTIGCAGLRPLALRPSLALPYPTLYVQMYRGTPPGAAEGTRPLEDEQEEDVPLSQVAHRRTQLTPWATDGEDSDRDGLLDDDKENGAPSTQQGTNGVHWDTPAFHSRRKAKTFQDTVREPCSLCQLAARIDSGPASPPRSRRPHGRTCASPSRRGLQACAPEGAEH